VLLHRGGAAGILKQAAHADAALDPALDELAEELEELRGGLDFLNVIVGTKVELRMRRRTGGRIWI